MEIKNSLLKNIDPYRAKLDSEESAATGRVRSPGGQEGTSPAAPKGDRVTLSSSALLHTAAHSAAGSAPEVRQEKVDAIKERIAAGEYHIDAKKIAEKLVQNEALLAGTLKD